MLLIFGFRGRWSKHQHETGEFFCPACGGDRTWVVVVLRRWFTVFFVPLFPSGKVLANGVECTTCHSRFDRDVLQQPTSSVMTGELQGSMRIAAAAVVRAAGAGAAAAGADAVRGTGLDGYDAAAMDDDVSTLDVSSLDDHLAYLAGVLSLPGREQFLGTLAGVARSGGGLEPARPLLEQAGQRLGMSTAHVAGVLAGTGVSPGNPVSGIWPAPPPPPTDAPG